MAGKLWDKGFEPDKMIEEYTVGDDRELDMRLARYDVEGSLAHIAMLEKIGLLTAEELTTLTAGLREIAAEILAFQGDMPLEKVKDLFCCETGYQTPKLATRAAVFQGERILLVQEPKGWALPGGWVDMDISVAENTVKEVREEAGLEVRAARLIALLDGERHHTTVYPWKVTIAFVLCTLVGGAFQENLETTASGWFPLDSMPPLDWEKTTREQLELCFRARAAVHWDTLLE